MAKYEINGKIGSKTVEADDFHTEGEFVDFVKDHDIVFRVKAAAVDTIERSAE